MWKDVIIGSGNKGTTGFCHHKYRFLSESKNAFWIQGLCAELRPNDLGMTVFKNTPEGEQISSLVREDVPVEQLEAFLTEMLFSHLTPQRLVNLFSQTILKGKELGRQEKTKEFRELLGIKDPRLF